MTTRNQEAKASELVTLADGHRRAIELLDSLRDAVSATCVRASERDGQPQSELLRAAMGELNHCGTEEAQRGFFSILEDFLAHSADGSNAPEEYELIAAEARGEISRVHEPGLA